MTAEEIKQYLTELNDELCLRDIKGEVSLFGGAVMCLVYDARPATKDVDAIFKPTAEIRDAVHTIAERNSLPFDWLNDGVKGYVVEHRERSLFNMSNLRVFVPEPDYLLAMKAIAARVDTADQDDVKVLIRELGLTRAEQVFDILGSYYPSNLIKPATQYFIEELFGS